MLSTNGEKYMAALPNLIKTCIGDAPLTVSLPFPISKYRPDSFRVGLDFHSSTNDPDCFTTTVRQTDVEITRRTRCWSVRRNDLRGD